METLVGYASEESENSPQIKRDSEEDKTDTKQAPGASLAAEWEAFESLLGGSAFAPEASSSGLPMAIPQPVAAPSCSVSGIPAPVSYPICTLKKDKSHDKDASESSSEESDSSSGSSKRGSERRRKSSLKKRVSRSLSSDSDSSNSSYSPSRATTDVGTTKKQQSDSSSDDSDSERQHTHSTNSSESSENSPQRPRDRYKSSDSDAPVSGDEHKDLASMKSVSEQQSKHTAEEPVGGCAGDVSEQQQPDASSSPSKEVTLRDRLLKIAAENCSEEASKADHVRRTRDVSSSRSPSPHKHRELKGRPRHGSRSRSREKGRRRGSRRRRSRSQEHSRRGRSHRSRSSSRHRRSRERKTSTSSVTKSPSKESRGRLSSTADDKDMTKSDQKKSPRQRSRSRSHHRRSKSRGHRSRSRSHRSRSRGRRSRSRHRRSRSRGRRSRSREGRSRKRGGRGRHFSPPAHGHTFEGHSRVWKKKRPLEKGRNCMMRSPSRSPSRQKARLYKLLKQTAPPDKRLTFKESLLKQLMQLQKDANAGTLTLDPSTLEALEAAHEKPSSLPLNSNNPLLAMMMAAGDKVTPQQALLQTMAAMHQKAQEMTGVAVPKYYNPAAVNPLKYAEQMQKRKLLWSKAKTDNKEEGVATWGGTSFSQDQDGHIAHKFRKLMGMKEGEDDDDEEHPANEEQQLKQQQLFDQLDKEYEFARMTTHTHRGIGLGFQSLGLPDN